MKRICKDERGFTLVEMLVVLMIISLLLLIALPNLSKNTDVAGEQGCQATQKLLQTQVAAYEIEHGTLPTNLQALVDEGYVDTVTCPNGKTLLLDGRNVVISP
ncbi:competence type IV pilus major pilin ComGC [Shouchella lonarensis]|uniref:ComG operon protein 3 n=1 Tax=Shouchella lonarensis TaxID=1464122 RepID=A0A1G6GP98_9BACI|nr:competence type IV pilus major pilin ComGC [Shouchella lonarensis]SDB83016.1 competence protein ComGC [Shouchella lonarensis]